MGKSYSISISMARASNMQDSRYISQVSQKLWQDMFQNITHGENPEMAESESEDHLLSWKKYIIESSWNLAHICQFMYNYYFGEYKIY